MKPLTPAEQDVRKKAIFNSMSQRQQRRIEKMGYEKWDPFQAPKDPIDIRRDKTRRTTQMLVREFLQSQRDQKYSTSYSRGVFDICLGLINDDEKCRAMYEFSCWYRDLLIKEGHQSP